MIHKTIKDEITKALRAKDAIRLDTLRGLNALCLNEMIATKLVTDFLPDEKVLPLVRRSVKQRRDSIEQFEKGGRPDLAEKEKKELVILEAFLPASMSKEEVQRIVAARIMSLRSNGQLDPKSSGKVIGMLMKELAGKADGNDVKTAVDELLAAA